MLHNFFNKIKYFALFVLNGLVFFTISILIDYFNGFYPLIIAMTFLYIVDKLEDRLLIHKSLFYLTFQLMSLIVYIFVYFIFIDSFIILDNKISFYFLFAVSIFVIKAVLLFTGKIKEWIN